MFCNVQAKHALRVETARLVAEFLARGGQIQIIR